MSALVAVYGSVTLFDHIVVVPRLAAASTTVFVSPTGDKPGQVLFGGCGANQAAALARLGTAVSLYGVVGDDFEQSGYADYLRRLGVDTETSSVVPGAASGHSYLVHSEDGGTFLIVEEGIATRNRPAHVTLPSLPPETTLLLVNMPFDDLALELSRRARDSGADVLLVGQLATTDEHTRSQLLECATYISCNEGEAVALDLLNPAAAARQAAVDLNGIWVTRGSAGITYTAADGDTYATASVPVQRIVDPTGAGDSAAAGIAAVLAAGGSVHEATDVAAVSASFALESFGCQQVLASRAQLTARFEAVHGHLPSSLALDPRTVSL